ncbi:MAG: acyltransferase, partial [Saprospiraceae bacterium]
MWSAISAFILKITGWRTAPEIWPLPPSYVLIVIPHTSNWDFPLGLLVRSSMKLDVKFAGKES